MNKGIQPFKRNNCQASQTKSTLAHWCSFSTTRTFAFFVCFFYSDGELVLDLFSFEMITVLQGQARFSSTDRHLN